jgi:1,4-alpha-glucan branching enzyme
MLKKKYFKSKPTCQVTFELPQDVEVKEASLVGDFNNWDVAANPLKKIKSVWKTTLELEENSEYQFRYLVNGSEWHNDEAADNYIPNNISGDNSVVVTYKNGG